MSEAPAAAINNGASVRASRADSEEAGVLSLLEDHNTHANNALSAASLTAALTAGTPVGVMHPEDIATMAMPQDLASHQARAVAALEQADTDHHLDHNRAHQHHQIVMPSMGALSQQQIQMDHGKQTFLLPPNMPHGSIGPSSHHLKDEGEIDNIPSITMPGSKPSTERLMPSSMSADFALTSSPHSICLCQAPTRIPRPRNAFILFRQHHHAAVVAQHPGKPNPEISKIIGQMWKGSAEEIKIVWQGHADVEKRQHLQRYPQYRYQPRRSGKKNAAAAAAAADPSQPMPLLETALCPTCGGRTGALPTLAPSTPVANRKGSQSARTAAAARKKAPSPEDSSRGNGGPGVEQAGIEALLQLGLRTSDDDLINSPSKRRKLNSASISPASSLMFVNQYTHASDPTIDPYLPQSSFDHHHHHDPTNDHHHHHHHHHHDIFPIKSIPILNKVHAVARICPPISQLSFSTPSAPRMPIISVDGDDVDAVADLYRALSAELKKPSEACVYCIDEPDDLTVLSEAYLEGLLSITGLDKDKETDDADAARYLNHVAFWRRKSSEMRRIVRAGRADEDPPQLVLINRYILSRSEAAALRLSTDGLTPLEHWQWCATVWRSCVGPDMTIYVQTLPEGDPGTSGGDVVESRGDGRLMVVRKATSGGKEWGDQVVRRLVIEIGALARSLRSGFPA